MVTPAVKKFLVAALLFSQTTLIHSCSDEEIAVSAAVVAVGAAASAISHDRRRDSCETARVENCYYDYWGRRQCEWRERRTCYQRRHHHFLETDNPSLSDAMNYFDTVPFDEAIEAADLASEYTLSMEAASRFLKAMKSAKEGSLQSIMDLGLGREDMEMLAQLKLPADASVDRLAKSLNQRPLLTKGMLSRMVIYGHKLRQEECKRLAEAEPNEERREYRHYCQ